jgi:hypothetical protein
VITTCCSTSLETAALPSRAQHLCFPPNTSWCACVALSAALWIGGIPDYIASRSGESNEGLQEELQALMTPFGTLENVKGRYKSPGAEGTQREQWMGQSWGLVTFVTLAAAEAARERGIAVPTSPPSKDAQGKPIPATTGYLVVKMIDRRLAEQSPVGRQQAEQNVIRMEAALRRYKQYVRQTTSLGTAATATASPSSIVVATMRFPLIGKNGSKIGVNSL